MTAPPLVLPGYCSCVGAMTTTRLLLLLLLFVTSGLTQTAEEPTSPSALDPLSRPECTKKEHPKVSIQDHVRPGEG
uniref:Uncharacterized protein n=1 Tax=Knipowitschia caucasica TaxID=637954 RepID=A0AAV2K1X0_KNICA